MRETMLEGTLHPLHICERTDDGKCNGSHDTSWTRVVFDIPGSPTTHYPPTLPLSSQLSMLHSLATAPQTLFHSSNCMNNTNDLFLGAWTIHLVIIAALKIFYDIIPGVSQETSWTLTNISYMFGSYLMFHWVRGVPFEFNSGAYDNLNMWEQIDNGDQYTPAKKFLLSVPIVLFLLSTHYTHYDLTYFTINFLAVLGVVIPKLPSV